MKLDTYSDVMLTSDGEGNMRIKLVQGMSDGGEAYIHMEREKESFLECEMPHLREELRKGGFQPNTI